MTVFVDTSAILALLDRRDANHPAAERLWQALVDRGEILSTTNYVLLESFALVQRRLGLAAARDLADALVPMFSIKWVDEDSHRAGLAAVLAAEQKRLSLVDCVSFEAMRELGAEQAFAFDRHFAEQGFTCVP